MTAAPQSEAERVAQLTSADFIKWLKSKKPEELWQFEYDWSFWARTDQRPPLGDWRTWFVMAGRGFGKTRMDAGFDRGGEEAGDAGGDRAASESAGPRAVVLPVG